jgi:hypothetical protein
MRRVGAADGRRILPALLQRGTAGIGGEHGDEVMRLAALAIAGVVAGGVARAEPGWDDYGFVQTAVYCVAVFEVRSEMASRWATGGASALDRVSADRIMQIAEQHGRGRCSYMNHGSTFSGSMLHGPYYTGCPWSLVEMSGEFSRQVRAVYEESGVAGAFPPTCMEDPACVACRDVLRAMTD